ncbi:MAG: dTDP-4-dehydrorhamnose 3,5-epimerase family protein [Planctomycetota bacterium]|jgi:dTDP-4-dehydrorhamnose 3,5-epimerase
MIDGVLVKKIQVYHDDRGSLMEVLKEGDLLFKNIKQTTFTMAYPGVIKAFHWHKFQYDLWFFTRGAAQVVLYDLRDDSPTRGETNVFYMGEKNSILLSIPPGVAHGYRVLGVKPASLFYHTTEAYDPENPDEERVAYNDPQIGFDWNTKPR